MASPDFILMVKSPERSVVVVVIFHESTTRQTRKPTLTGFSECEQKLCLSERLTDTATTFLQGMMENIQEVKLKKILNGLGFSFFISELDTSLDCGSIVRIRTLFPGQPAEESGQIQEGDVILSINGQPLKGLSYQQVLQCLRISPSEVQLVLCRPAQGGRSGDERSSRIAGSRGSKRRLRQAYQRDEPLEAAGNAAFYSRTCCAFRRYILYTLFCFVCVCVRRRDTHP
ncbi:unnamed protein product [Leuciscus chuanchicus]